LKDFQKSQLEFTATIRDPDKHKTPAGIEERRMAIYRELVYNNIEDLLANFFPVLKEITAAKRWHQIVRSFVAIHKSRTPVFMKLAEEFLEFLHSEYQAQKDDPQYLLELAHYEWVEIGLGIATEQPDLSVINKNGHLLNGVPVLSPLAWALTYNYPVHQISPEFSPSEPAQTHLVVYRDSNDEVQFMALNPVSARLLDLLEINQKNETRTCGRQLLIQIANETQHPNPDVVIKGGLHIMEEWLKRDIVLGTYK
jgi:hypothetical protein